MKLIIDITDEEYKTLSKMSEKEKVNELSYYERAIANGIPYEERLHGKLIPVSERFPNRDEYIKNNGLFIVSDGNRSYFEWYDIYDKRRFGEPTISGFRVDKCVIAWMPLPEPYKESDE